MSAPTNRTIPITLLLSSVESASALLGDESSGRPLNIALNDDVAIQGDAPIKTSGLSTTEILIQAAMTIGTTVTINVLSGVLLDWLKKAKSPARVQIGCITIEKMEQKDIEAAIQSALAKPSDDRFNQARMAD